MEGVQILRKITPEYSELFCDAKAPALPEKKDGESEVQKIKEG